MNPMFDLNGKVAVVIGGGGVLAGEMAMGLARAGADGHIAHYNIQGLYRDLVFRFEGALQMGAVRAARRGIRLRRQPGPHLVRRRESLDGLDAGQPHRLNSLMSSTVLKSMNVNWRCCATCSPNIPPRLAKPALSQFNLTGTANAIDVQSQQLSLF